MSHHPITDRIALVTGAGRANGLGQAIIRRLLTDGVRTVHATVRRAGELDSLVAGHPGRVVEHVLDLTDAAAIAGLPARTGPVGLLINNAGVFSGQAAVGAGDWDAAMFAVNYLAPRRLVEAYRRDLAGGTV
ncbi:MAG: hypothetical protein RLZZ127_1907, partial [Planctomycetota bacterium]